MKRIVHTSIACLLALSMSVASALAAQGARDRSGDGEAAQQEVSEFGPALTAYFGFIDNEEDELNHLYEAGEVPKDEYVVAANRLTVMRDATRRVAVQRKVDVVPELHILLAEELTQVLPDGVAALRGKKSGDRVGDDWIYHGRVRKGSFFYVLEHVGNIERIRPY